MTLKELKKVEKLALKNDLKTKSTYSGGGRMA